MLKVIAVASTLTLFLVGCQTSEESGREERPPESSDAIDEAHSSRNSVDWPGVYRGIVPCGDCEGIRTVLRLYPDETYLVQEKFLGRSEDIFESYGDFDWDEAGNAIIFEDVDSTRPWMYQVGENRVIQRDLKGNRVSGDLADSYVLTKAIPGLTGKYWNLLRLGGRPVMGDGQGSVPYLTFRAVGNAVEGHTGCNSFKGSYELKATSIIKFYGMVSTKMACPTMDTETLMLRALGLVEYYSIVGDTLYLDESGKMPLLAFQADYMR